MVIMRILEKWGIAATFVCGGLLFLACANNDNSAPDTSALDLWQAGKTVTTETVTAYGGIDKCFAAEPIPDGETQMRDNNSSCFCYRAIAGSTKLSKHARGLAIDINTLYNPYYRDLDDGTRFIQPATAEAYCDRSWDFPYKIDHEDLCFRLFTEAGFEWGGDWTTRKDYQHFELIE